MNETIKFYVIGGVVVVVVVGAAGVGVYYLFDWIIERLKQANPIKDVKVEASNKEAPLGLPGVTVETKDGNKHTVSPAGYTKTEPMEGHVGKDGKRYATQEEAVASFNEPQGDPGASAIGGKGETP